MTVFLSPPQMLLIKKKKKDFIKYLSHIKKKIPKHFIFVTKWKRVPVLTRASKLQHHLSHSSVSAPVSWLYSCWRAQLNSKAELLLSLIG